MIRAEETAVSDRQVNKMKIEQFVMAYEAEQDRLRAMLPEAVISLRPVLRINAEVRDEKIGYLEFNTPVEKNGNRGWMNIGFWENVAFYKEGKTTSFVLPELEISFTGVGLAGGCPAEKDNAGCYFGEDLRLPENISANKEYCDCRFVWKIPSGTAGKSTGKTLPAYPTEVKIIYPHQDLCVENAARIPCAQVLGTYVVAFERTTD